MSSLHWRPTDRAAAPLISCSGSQRCSPSVPVHRKGTAAQRRALRAERLFRPDLLPGLRNTIPLLVPEEMRCIAWVTGRAGLHEAISRPLGTSPGHSVGRCYHHPIGRSVQGTELFTHTTTTSTSHPGGKPPAAADRPGCTVAFSAKHTDTSRSWCCSAIPPGEQLRCFVLLLPAKCRQLPFGESSGLEQPGRSMTWDLPHGPPPLHPPRRRLAKPRLHNSQAFFQEHGQGAGMGWSTFGQELLPQDPRAQPRLGPIPTSPF